jgi:uncharacterized membrane protein YoaK (UPF0700 family)
MVRSLSRRTFAAAAVLAAFAGYVDGFAFVYLGGYFVSFMSGNTTQASVDLAAGSWIAAGYGFALICSFVVGAMTGTVIPDGRWRAETGILTFVLGTLVIAAAAAMTDWHWLAGIFLAFGMGALNTVFARDGEVSFGITYMTGALVKLGQTLVGALQGGPPTAWVRYFVMWVSIAIGAVVGTLVHAVLGGAALWCLAATIAVLLVIPAARRWLTGATDEGLASPR